MNTLYLLIYPYLSIHNTNTYVFLSFLSRNSLIYLSFYIFYLFFIVISIILTFYLVIYLSIYLPYFVLSFYTYLSIYIYIRIHPSVRSAGGDRYLRVGAGPGLPGRGPAHLPQDAQGEDEEAAGNPECPGGTRAP